MASIELRIQSDIFHQVKPSKLPELRKCMETMNRHSPYRFSGKGQYLHVDHVNRGWMWAAFALNFSNEQVYGLLSKAIKIVENTEEYTKYLLQETFGDESDKKFFTPPGTVRFYSQDLICFFNGKSWRHLKL